VKLYINANKGIITFAFLQGKDAIENKPKSRKLNGQGVRVNTCIVKCKSYRNQLTEGMFVLFIVL